MSASIVELRIASTLGITAATIPVGEGVTCIGGENGEGKSSCLNSLAMLLWGVKFPEPIKHGAKAGRIEADLADVLDVGELTVTRTLTPSGGTLTIKNKAGASFPSPQAMLDKIVGARCVDPLEFTRLKPLQKLEALRELVGVNTALLDASYATAFEERTVVNRKVKELEAQIAGMKHHEDAPAEPLSAGDLSAQLREANAKNEERAQFIRDGQQAAKEHGVLVADITALETQIAAMQKTLAAKKEEETSKAAALNGMRVHAAELVEIDTAAIVARLDQITELNRKSHENTLRADAAEALAKHQKSADDLTTRLETLAAKKREKIAAAKYPVAGLTLGDTGVLFDDGDGPVPFEQVNSARQIEVSVAMALAMQPHLKVCLVREGALLGKVALEDLCRIVTAAGAQALVERVGDGSECRIIIEAGEVKEVRA